VALTIGNDLIPAGRGYAYGSPNQRSLAMRTARIAIVALCFSLGLAAQSVRTQTASLQVRPSPSAVSTAAAPERPDLDALMFDLQRFTVATDSDIADLDIDRWKTGWRTAWLKSDAHKQQAGQIATSLQHNLAQAMPGLISEVQTSRGSVSATFKLYNDLNVVVESLDSLIEASRASGRKGESGPLAKDYEAMGRVRQQLSTYIQQTAASLEPRVKLPSSGPHSAPSSSAQLPKRTVIDDNAPDRRAKKKTASLDQ
jgi:hypothetical protein